MTASSEEGAVSQGAAPVRKSRGTAASSELVDVYRILTEAGKPLTVFEIAEQMPKTGYASAAMQAYRKHKEETDPTWLEGKSDRWSAAAQAEAMIWWVRRIVRLGCNTKKITVASKTHAGGHVGVVTEGTYIPGRPPKVRRMIYVEQPGLVDWTPELSEQLNQGHTAGMQFLACYKEFLMSQRQKMSDARELLALAERAIRKDQ